MSLIIDFIRHSEALYKTYLHLLEVNPCGSFDSVEQIHGDLTEGGILLAKESATNYFSECGDYPVIFTSSNEARAMETAHIYSQVALDQNISGSDLLIRQGLSVNPKIMLLNVVFASNKQHDDLIINWDLVPKPIRTKYLSLRKIIEKEDTGSWMQNVIKHSDLVTGVFPENDLLMSNYRSQFNQEFASLVKMGLENQESNRILAFTHENVLAPITAEYFQGSDVHNCEKITFTITDEGEILCRFRDQEKRIMLKSKKDLL